MTVQTFGTLVLAGGAVAVVVWLVNKIGRALTAVLEALATVAMVLVALWLLVKTVYHVVKAAVTHWRTTLGVTVVGAWVCWWGLAAGRADGSGRRGGLGRVAVAASALVRGVGAALGLDATGIDVAAAPLRAAEGKARDRGLTARFLRHDVRRLAELVESFDTVLDCGLFHIFGGEDRAAYVDSVRSVLVPGGRYFLLCFSDQQPGDGGPHRLTRDDITTAFANGWRVNSIKPTTLDSPTGGIHGWLVALAWEDNPC